MSNLCESENYRQYISLLQENITRMASNSSSCKTWLITIVSALLALEVTNDKLSAYLWIALIPTMLFCFLDAYYLGQEKRFRDIEDSFVKTIMAGEDVPQYLYSFNIYLEKKAKYFWRGLKSPSTYLLYAAVVIILVLISCLLK